MILIVNLHVAGNVVVTGRGSLRNISTHSNESKAEIFVGGITTTDLKLGRCFDLCKVNKLIYTRAHIQASARSTFDSGVSGRALNSSYLLAGHKISAKISAIICELKKTHEKSQRFSLWLYVVLIYWTGHPTGLLIYLVFRNALRLAIVPFALRYQTPA